MDEKEKINLIDKVLQGLNNSELNTVPELIDGFQKYPFYKSEKDLKYRIIEQELLDLNLAIIIGGGGNKSINGYYYFQITPIAIEYILDKKSIKEIYQTRNLKNDQDSKIKNLTLEKLEFEKKIRKLESQLKITNLIKIYWWLIASAIALGFSISELIKNM